MLNQQKIQLFSLKLRRLMNDGYPYFVVWITPCSIPLALYTRYQGQVQALDVCLLLGFYIYSGLGISLGYHRLISHRGYQTSRWLKKILLIGGAMAIQGPPVVWASLHLQHHHGVDSHGDPHSPHYQNKGFWHAHCGWLFTHYQPNLPKYGRKLLKDPEVAHATRYYPYYALLGLGIPALVGGWVGLIWGGLLRILLLSHATWSVNSICHLWGSQPYPSVRDHSKNNLWIALLTFGEGWHNNHHRQLQTPYYSQKWYQLDLGGLLLQMLQKIGLIWQVRPAKSP
jgi:stearoyl-CoA desaturase (delta-9 desaturase)